MSTRLKRSICLVEETLGSTSNKYSTLVKTKFSEGDDIGKKTEPFNIDEVSRLLDSFTKAPQTFEKKERKHRG